MLRLDVRHLVEMHGEEHLQAYLISVGLTAREARTVAHTAKTRVLRDSLVQLVCEGLLCTPNDVFRWFGGAESHLAQLNTGREPTMGELLSRVKDPGEVELLVARALELADKQPKKPRMHGGRLFLNVRRMLELRAVKKPRRELRRMGFTGMEASRLLSPERRAFKLTLLTRVCEAFQCLPNDVFDFEGPDGHVLQAVRKLPVVSVDKRLQGLTEVQLREVLRALRL